MVLQHGGKIPTLALRKTTNVGIFSQTCAIINFLLDPYFRVERYWICDMQLLHEPFVVIIAILHVKTEAQLHIVWKVCNISMSAFFHWEVVLKHNFADN